ncbi:hypothetical protein H257_07800, partial [Aphanomyces astaci]
MTSNQGHVQSPPDRHNSTSTPPNNGMLYKMTAELFVKDTVCARDHSGKRLTPTTFEGTNWGAIKTQIFDQCRPHMENKASYANGQCHLIPLPMTTSIASYRSKWDGLHSSRQAAHLPNATWWIMSTRRSRYLCTNGETTSTTRVTSSNFRSNASKFLNGTNPVLQPSPCIRPWWCNSRSGGLYIAQARLRGEFGRLVSCRSLCTCMLPTLAWRPHRMCCQHCNEFSALLTNVWRNTICIYH